MSLGVPAGKTMGALLAELLEDVIDGRLPNERDALLTAAKEKLEKSLSEIRD